MRLLLVGAGTEYSTRDVEEGYAAALRDLGVDVRLYALFPFFHQRYETIFARSIRPLAQERLRMIRPMSLAG